MTLTATVEVQMSERVTRQAYVACLRWLGKIKWSSFINLQEIKAYFLEL